MDEYSSALNKLLQMYREHMPVLSDTPGRGVRGYDTLPHGYQHADTNLMLDEYEEQLRQDRVNRLGSASRGDPSLRMGIYELYRQLERQKLDQRLNEAQFSRGMNLNDMIMREHEYLNPYPKNQRKNFELPPGYQRDPSGGFSAYPKMKGWKPYSGRWM